METRIEFSTNQYLSFNMGTTQYAINVEMIQSVLQVPEIIKVPNTPDFIRGIINLRGDVIPVIDLMLKFGLAEMEITIDSAIIVLELQIEKDKIVIGILADEVQEVIEMNKEQIKPAPKVGSGIHIDFIQAVGKKDDQFLIILDIDKIFSHIELEETEKSAGRELVS